MTSRLSTILVMAAVTAGGVFAAGDPITTARPAPDAPHVLWGADLSSSAAGDVGRRLGPLLAAPPVWSSDLLKQLQEYSQTHPSLTPQQLAQEFVQRNPGFQNPALAQSLRDQFGPLIDKLPAAIPPPPPTPAPAPVLPSEPPTPSPAPPAGSQPPPGELRAEPTPPAVGDRPGPAGRSPTAGPRAANPEELARRVRQLKTLSDAWEKHLGPLAKSPDVQRMMADMVSGSGSLDPEALEGLAAAFGDPDADPGEFARWLESVGPPSAGDFFSELGIRPQDFEMPRFGLDFLPAIPAPSGRSPVFRTPGGPASWAPVVGLAVAGVVGLVLWRLRPTPVDVGRPAARLPAGVADVADRAGLIRSFEALTVAVCGPAAKSWHHATIAAGLRRAVPAAADAAGPLAELYAVARYAPSAGPLPPAAVEAARAHLGRLAGAANP